MTDTEDENFATTTLCVNLTASHTSYRQCGDGFTLHFKWCIVSTWELVFCFSGRSPPDFNFLHRIRSDVFLHFFVIFTFIFHIKVLIGGGVVGLTSSLTLTDTTCITCNYEYKLCDNSQLRENLHSESKSTSGVQYCTYPQGFPQHQRFQSMVTVYF